MMANRGAARTVARDAGVARNGRPATQTREARAPILDLAIYLDKQVRVKFAGGREVTGTLKGFDALLNLVLDDVEEKPTEDSNTQSRSLGLVVLRGTAIVVISPTNGMEEIANPFAQ